MIRKRIWTIISVLAGGMLLAGCGSSSGDTKPITSSGAVSSEEGTYSGTYSAQEELSEDDDAANEQTTADSSDTTVEEQVLLDAEDVKVTATGFTEDDIWGDGIKLLIENNGSSDIGVGSKATIVNHYMISDLFSATVAAGKKSNETMYLSSSGLEAAGIDNIGQIEIYFYLFDADTYMTIYEADPVTIRTNQYDVMDTEPNDDGQELYSRDGIRIVGKYVDEDSFWGNAIVLYLENHSDRNVGIQCDDMSVNGFMVTPFFSCDVYAGKMAISDITLMQSELDENGITSVDEVELKFHIYDPDTYETITDTDAITFSTK